MNQRLRQTNALSETFRELADAHSNFNYHTAISREAEPLYVSDLISGQIDYFAPLLAGARTVIYVCGLEGMERGLFDVLLQHGLAEGYVTRKGEQLKTTARCRLEVY